MKSSPRTRRSSIESFFWQISCSGPLLLDRQPAYVVQPNQAPQLTAAAGSVFGFNVSSAAAAGELGVGLNRLVQ